MLRILLTGASGALARAVSCHLNSLSQFKIFATTSKECAEIEPNIMALKCNYTNPSELRGAFNEVEPDLIFHLGASFTNNIREMYSLNVAPAIELLELTLSSEKKARVVLVGSAAEYGMVHADENPIDENHVLSPISIYGMSKAWQTQAMGIYADRGADVVCARIFNLHGPGVSESLFTGRLQKQIIELKAGLRSCIEVGTLGAIRDYISTDEAAKQLLTIAKYGLAGQVYHVGSGVAVSMRDLMTTQLKLNDIDPHLVRESINYYKKQDYDIPIIFADMEKTKRLQQQEEKCLQQF